MTTAFSESQQQPLHSSHTTSTQPGEIRAPPPPSLAVPQPVSGPRSGHLNLATFSPVGQNGSFIFDRLLKSGEVHKRTRKTKQWKSFHLVVRPNLLSLYKSATEERLLKQISLSDLTAVAYLKDPKGRRPNLFGLYSPARNWHLQAPSAAEAQTWVELIKREARIDEEEQEMFVGSPTGHEPTQGQQVPVFKHSLENDRFGSSSPEPLDSPHSPHSITTRDGIKIPGIRHPSAQSIEYSGDELSPGYSDFSDTPSQNVTQTSGFGSFLNKKHRQSVRHQTPYAAPIMGQQIAPQTARNASQSSGFHTGPQDEEKVIWHGYLLYLKSKGGVRQWKRTWVVLRPKNLAFYKNDEEYAANLIIPLSNVISAVEIDPISKSKNHCIQIIAEEKSYRFCAPSEDALAEWLGALKSQLARRKEKGAARAQHLGKS